MRDPTIQVLGVYRLNVTDELVREQHSILYPDSLGVSRAISERQIREQLESVVLIEALVLDRNSRFDVGDFTQAQVGVPRDSWQVAWAEAYLSFDGTSLAVNRWSPAPTSGDLRIAFFIHGWNPASPLLSSYGEVTSCPQPQPMPDRLAQLVPFEPVD
jgi:hypothetical protein